VLSGPDDACLAVGGDSVTFVFAPRWWFVDPRRHIEVVMLVMGGWLIWRDPVTVATLNQPGVARAIGFLCIVAAVWSGTRWVWMAVAPNPALQADMDSIVIRACSPPTRTVLYADVDAVSFTSFSVTLELATGRNVTIFPSAMRDETGAPVEPEDLADRLKKRIRAAKSS
jgi:hypothetical protein